MIRAQLSCQEAEQAMLDSKFHFVYEKYLETAQHYQDAASVCTNIDHRKHLDSFRLYYSRKAHEAEIYLQQSNPLFADSGLTSSEDSDSEDTSQVSQRPPPRGSDRQSSPRLSSPSLDVIPSRPRTGSTTHLSKSPSAEAEYAYAAALEKRMSSSPLQALAMGLQTVRDMVLGPKNNNLPTSSNPSSLSESFFLISDSTESTEREQKLQSELQRLQGEFAKLQSLLEKATSEHATRNKTISGSSSKFMREAQMKQSLRESCPSESSRRQLTASPSSISNSTALVPLSAMSTSEMEAEIQRLRTQLAISEKKNEEWAIKWDQIKAKAIKKRQSRSISQSAMNSTLDLTNSDLNSISKP